ncbi:23S rRNA (pseudouridine(1915)-N(3))-methyltransferase RlmH [Pinisolibacter aquiterrae]|uniref:23S rRNA (pseudouridine(1915)-N(3))-methyltransferase RlmH n=1 Tax=Pinisolibacter aquiterrae TaxID=2815579 RepID=UPI001C3D7197|nr:23S rRNA (pseudouridine(1915)-N(3))-methyltransferase RlmH [Pinisolibacter aquiterrae]MCC8233491.1 23S rRNA (pseudouridine(1915)-N(3))-methyltransferase RlmH [Pinisolibacter aquiterrae]
MRVTIAAVGRMKAGPERELLDRYLDRAAKQGRVLGVTRVEVREIPESRAARAEDRKAEEAEALLAGVADTAWVIVLDETGTTRTSQAFADDLAARLAEARDWAILIGGADGHGPAVLARADLRLAFGAMTWPHQIVRILAAEQIYRATTILAGHPYHRA